MNILATLGKYAKRIVKHLNSIDKEKIPNASKLIDGFAELYSGGKMDKYQIKALVSPNKKTLVIAGAGAGKTDVLKKRIVLFNKFLNIKIENMLVLAFNTKAAEEIRERVALELKKRPADLRRNIRTIHSFALEYVGKIYPGIKVIIDKDVETECREYLESKKVI